MQWLRERHQIFSWQNVRNNAILRTFSFNITFFELTMNEARGQPDAIWIFKVQYDTVRAILPYTYCAGRPSSHAWHDSFPSKAPATTISCCMFFSSLARIAILQEIFRCASRAWVPLIQLWRCQSWLKFIEMMQGSTSLAPSIRCLWNPGFVFEPGLPEECSRLHKRASCLTHEPLFGPSSNQPGTETNKLVRESCVCYNAPLEAS